MSWRKAVAMHVCGGFMAAMFTVMQDTECTRGQKYFGWSGPLTHPTIMSGLWSLSCQSCEVGNHANLVCDSVDELQPRPISQINAHCSHPWGVIGQGAVGVTYLLSKRSFLFVLRIVDPCLG